MDIREIDGASELLDQIRVETHRSGVNAAEFEAALQQGVSSLVAPNDDIGSDEGAGDYCQKNSDHKLGHVIEGGVVGAGIGGSVGGTMVGALLGGVAGFIGGVLIDVVEEALGEDIFPTIFDWDGCGNSIISGPDKGSTTIGNSDSEHDSYYIQAGDYKLPVVQEHPETA